MEAEQPGVDHAADRFQDLVFWYCNPEKIEGLFSQLNGRLETEQRETLSKGGARVGRLGLQIGSLLAALGLGSAKASGEVRSDYQTVLEVTTSLSLENKTALLLAHLRSQSKLLELELLAQRPEKALQLASDAHFGIVSGHFSYHCLDDDRAELQSIVRRLDAQGPLCRVPLFTAHHLKNQAINSFGWDDAEPFPHEVFCECLIQTGAILANPIAVWLPHADPGGPLRWSTGSDTPYLDETTGVPPAA